VADHLHKPDAFSKLRPSVTSLNMITMSAHTNRFLVFPASHFYVSKTRHLIADPPFANRAQCVMQLSACTKEESLEEVPQPAGKTLPSVM